MGNFIPPINYCVSTKIHHKSKLIHARKKVAIVLEHSNYSPSFQPALLQPQNQ